MSEITLKLCDTEDGNVSCLVAGVDHLKDLNPETELTPADSLFIELYSVILEISGMLAAEDYEDEEEEYYEDYPKAKPALKVIKGGLDKEETE